MGAGLFFFLEGMEVFVCGWGGIVVLMIVVCIEQKEIGLVLRDKLLLCMSRPIIVLGSRWS